MRNVIDGRLVDWLQIEGSHLELHHVDIFSDDFDLLTDLIDFNAFVDVRVAFVFLCLIFESVRVILDLFQIFLERSGFSDVPTDRVLLLQVCLGRLEHLDHVLHLLINLWHILE